MESCTAVMPIQTKTAAQALSAGVSHLIVRAAANVTRSVARQGRPPQDKQIVAARD